MSSPGSNPLGGSSRPSGVDSLMLSPFSFINSSVTGSKSTRPERASAITVSGEVTKARVAGSPSFRLGKFLL